MLWSPDKQEQRYCWSCQKWYHVDCLGAPSDISQNSYMDRVAEREEYGQTPKTILIVAFQPTARGGLTHFTAGNIRMVSQARSLLSSEERHVVEQSGWMMAHLIEESRENILDDDWIKWLESEFGIDKKDVCEKLLVEDQLYYTCPTCNSSLLI
jgi:hypothetical protein